MIATWRKCSLGPTLELEQAGDVERAEEWSAIEVDDGVHVVGANCTLEVPQVHGEEGLIELDAAALVDDRAVAQVAPDAVEDLSEAVRGAVGVAVGPQESNDALAIGAAWSARSRKREEREGASALSASVGSFANSEGAERREVNAFS